MDCWQIRWMGWEAARWITAPGRELFNRGRVCDTNFWSEHWLLTQTGMQDQWQFTRMSRMISVLAPGSLQFQAETTASRLQSLGKLFLLIFALDLRPSGREVGWESLSAPRGR